MSRVSKVVFFVGFGLVLGGVVEFILHKVSSPIPYKVVVFYVGILFAIMCRVIGVQAGHYIDDNELSTDIMLYGLLPTLLFSETMHLNLLHFRRSFVQSALIAGPGGVMTACSLAVCAYVCLPFNWSWNYNFLFGAVMVATDPVSVVSLLKEAKGPSSLSTIISGESLLNDGTAMFLYLFFFHSINGTVYTVRSFIGFLAEMLLLSPLIGFGTGLVCFGLSRRTSRPTNLHMNFQIALTFVAAYASYYISQKLLGISGVLASCAAGVTVALLVNPSIVEHEQMHEVWSKAEWCCNTLVFLLGGFIGGDHTFDNFTVKNVALLLGMYVLLMLTRALMVATLYPVLSRVGMKMTVPEASFIVFAGLRGALVIALALDASRNARNRGDSDVGGQMFFIVTGLVSMTLLFNHTGAARLMIWLKLVEDPEAPMSMQKKTILLHIKRYMKETVQKALAELEHELGAYDEEEVARLCSLQHSEYGDFAVGRASMDDFTEARANSVARTAQDKLTRGAPVGTLGKILAPTPQPDELSQELVVFARTALLDVVKARYMHSIHTGKIGSSVMAAKILLYSVDVAQDHVHESLQDWAMVAASLTPSNGFIAGLRRMDEIVYRVCGRHAALVPFLDAVNERNALYVLINFIDAHEYALDKLQFILGVYDGNVEEGGAGGAGGSGGGGDGGSDKGNNSGNVGDGARSRLNSARTTSTDVARFSQVEMHKVILETVDHLSKARHLLTLINPEHLKQVYTHRAARVILIKQEETLRRMVVEGTLSTSLAHTLFKSLTDESDRVNIARAEHDRVLIRETRQRKAEEEESMRASFSAALTESATVAVSTSALYSAAAADPVAFERKFSDTGGVHSAAQQPGGPVLARSNSLRRTLTEDGSLRASFSTTGRARPSLTAPAANSAKSKISSSAASMMYASKSSNKFSDGSPSTGEEDGGTSGSVSNPMI